MAAKYEDRLIGKTFEKCRIIAKLGTGGMGSVWLAEHFGLGRKVAVKILPPEMGRDPEYVARFMREATTAGRMEHPNIVQIHDVGYAEGRHFIVMQYVDGESLSTVVEHLGAMEPRDAAKIAAGILRGLHHAHEEGVVHRDVKPDNVLISKGDEPKLLDFGLAIETETALQITKDGMVVGTPYYLAPEQARGQKATPLCDVYAAGVTLYYLLTGKRPFVGATALAVLNKHIHEPPVPPMKHKADIPKPLNDIVLKMMAKKPADRYQSAGAAAADLDSFLKGKQIQVRVPVSLPFGIDRLSRKQRILAGSGAGAVIILGILLLVLAFSGGPPPEPPATRSRPASAPRADVSVEWNKLQECIKFADQHRDDIAQYPDVFNLYDQFIHSATSGPYLEKAQTAKKDFHDYVERKSIEELGRILKVSNPYQKVKLLGDFPRPLIDLTDIDRRLREERALAASEAAAKYLADEKKLDAAISEGHFKEAAPMLDQLMEVAEGLQLERLKRLKEDFGRLKKEFDYSTLRRLTEDYGSVHASFESHLNRRENVAAYLDVTKFLKGLVDEERLRTRVQGVNYEHLFKLGSGSAFQEASALLQARTTLATAFLKAQNALPFRILSDLQDALDLELLVKSAVDELYKLSNEPTEIRLATFGGSGRVVLNMSGFGFHPKAGADKSIKIDQLRPDDYISLAALSEGKTVEELYDNNDLICRAAGAAYLYSGTTERWAQADRWFRRAGELGLQGLDYRLAGFREHGYQEVRDQISASQTLLLKKDFEGAKRALAGVQNAWAHDRELKNQIGKAMATILVAEILQHDRFHEYDRLKLAARTLRSSCQGLYREEDVLGPYAHALLVTGNWEPVGSDLKNDWTWEGKAQGKEAPAVEEQSRGLRLRPDGALDLVPRKTRGATGMKVSLSLTSVRSSFSAGLRFDLSEGTYHKLVIRETGELTLYEGSGLEEKRLDTVTLGKRLADGEWAELAVVAEAGDLACFVGDRPVLLKRLSLPASRGIGIWTTSEANFRLMELRK